MDNVDCLSVIANHCDVQTALRLAATSKTNWDAFGFNANRENHKAMKKKFQEILDDIEGMVECYEVMPNENEKFLDFLWDEGLYDRAIYNRWDTEEEVREFQESLGPDDLTMSDICFQDAVNLSDMCLADIMYEFPNGPLGSNYTKAILEEMRNDILRFVKYNF